jgi:hypothetical protein
MKTIDTILQKVYDGQVLDDDGEWISIDKRLEITEEIIGHISKGHVLVDGGWVPVIRAQKMKSKAGSQ